MFISSINLKIGSNKILENNNNNDINFTVSDDGNNNVTNNNLLSHRELIYSGDKKPVTTRLSPDVSRRRKGVATVSAVHEVSHVDINSVEFVKVENKHSGKISGLIQQFNKVDSSQRSPNLLPKKLKCQHLHQNQLVNQKNRGSQSGNIDDAEKSNSGNKRSLDPADVVDRRQSGVLRIPEIALNFRIKANEEEVLANGLTSNEAVSYPEVSSSISQGSSTSRQLSEQVLVKSEELHPETQQLHQLSLSPVPVVERTPQSDRDSPISNRHSKSDIVSDYERKTQRKLPVRAVNSSSKVPTFLSNEKFARQSFKKVEPKHGLCQLEAVRGRVHRFEVDACDKSKNPNFRFPLVRSAGVDEPHVSTTAGVDETQVSTSANVDDTQVSTSANVDDIQLSTSANVDDTQVSTSANVDETQVSTSANVDETQLSIPTCVDEAHVSTSSEQKVPLSTIDHSYATQPSDGTLTRAYNKETLNYSAIEDRIVYETTECSTNGRKADIQSGQINPGNSAPDDETDFSDKRDVDFTTSLANHHSQCIPINHPEDKNDGFGSKLDVLKSELMSLRQMDLVLLRQLMNISQSLQRIQRTEVPRVSRSLTFLSHKKPVQRRHWPVERQNSAPHVEHWRRFMFSSLQSATEDEVTDSFSSFDESEFDSQSELEESTTSLNSPFVPSPRSAAANKRRFFHSRDRIWTMDVTDDLDIDYEGILRRNVQLWKSLKMQNSVTEEVTVWY